MQTETQRPAPVSTERESVPVAIRPTEESRNAEEERAPAVLLVLDNVYFDFDKYDRMIAQAEQLGANAVVDVRYSTSYITGNAAEILVDGTAVVVE